MDADDANGRLVVATSGRLTTFIDLRKSDQEMTAKVSLERESSLKYQLRSIKFFPDGRGVAIGSIEGRVSIEHLEELGLPPNGAKYTFKCHRLQDRVYPVNCIDFHPRLGTFATGGCDGTVGKLLCYPCPAESTDATLDNTVTILIPSDSVVWDGLNKRKLTSLPPFPTSIAALAFHPGGNELAVASSYTFEEGEREHPRDEIYIRPMLDSECTPKSKS